MRLGYHKKGALVGLGKRLEGCLLGLCVAKLFRVAYLIHTLSVHQWTSWTYPTKMQTQNMEVGDFSNANMICSSPELMKECEMVSRRPWTHLALPKSQMCGVCSIAPMPTNLRREDILSPVKSAR